MIRLTKRERILAVALASVVVVWLGFALIVGPALDRLNTLNRVIPEKQAELAQLRAAAEEYVLLQDSLEEFRAKAAAQDTSFELLPFLESQVRLAGLEGKVGSMKQKVLPLKGDYSETVVEIEFKNLTLSALVDFLSQVESGPADGGLTGIKTLYIKKSRTDKNLLDSVVEIRNAAPSATHLARK